MPKKRKKQKSNKKKIIIIAVSGFALCCFIYFSIPKMAAIFSNFLDPLAKSTCFIIKDINIIGASKKTEPIIKKEIGLFKNDNIFKISSRKIYKNIMKIGWVKSAIVRKNLPNILTIKIVEKIPISVFQHDSKFSLIDENGDIIEDIKEKPAELPIISGDEANIKAFSILEIISKFENLKNKIESMTLVRKRRWNINCSDIQIKLPENNIEKSLEIFSTLLKQDNINKNTIKTIDFRVPGNVIINGLKEKTAKKKIKV